MLRSKSPYHLFDRNHEELNCASCADRLLRSHRENNVVSSFYCARCKKTCVQQVNYFSESEVHSQCALTHTDLTVHGLLRCRVYYAGARGLEILALQERLGGAFQGPSFGLSGNNVALKKGTALAAMSEQEGPASERQKWIEPGGLVLENPSNSFVVRFWDLNLRYLMHATSKNSSA
jgi:hypothetical protein